jgi:hypothetical protein
MYPTTIQLKFLIIHKHKKGPGCRVQGTAVIIQCTSEAWPEGPAERTEALTPSQWISHPLSMNISPSQISKMIIFLLYPIDFTIKIDSNNQYIPLNPVLLHPVWHALFSSNFHCQMYAMTFSSYLQVHKWVWPTFLRIWPTFKLFWPSF